MNRREVIASIGAGAAAAAFSAGLPGSLLSAAEDTQHSPKKGWAGGSVRYHQQFGAKWYYTWSPKTRPSKVAEFVPMIKAEWSLRQVPAIRAMKGISHLLGFNEPERVKQGNISVERALEIWPKLAELAVAKKLRLGSPAPSSDNPGMDWLAAFMEQAQRDKLKVDFLAVHWYRSRDPEAFEAYVKKLARDYRLPLWITEFNGWTGPEEENYEFLEESLKFLGKDKNVERFAYFDPGKGKAHSLLDKSGSLTRMGELYRDA